MHYKSICDAILSRIHAAINSESFLNQFKEPNRFTRKRLVSMYQVIVYLFYSNKAAIFQYPGFSSRSGFPKGFQTGSFQSTSEYQTCPV